MKKSPQRCARLLLPFLLLWGSAGLNSAVNAAIVITSGTTLGAGNTADDGQDVAVTGCTVTIDGTHNFTSLSVNGSATVNLGGASALTVTGALSVTGTSMVICQGANTSGTSGGIGVAITAASVNVASDSGISADGQGYLGAGTPGIPGAGPGGGQSQGTYGNGGGYGGLGGGNGATGGAPGGGTYDLASAATPTDLGSGGSAYFSGASPGSNGGGAIRMTVSQTLTLDGIISANGAAPDTQTGGCGAGGSLYITTGTLAGSGTFSVNGGSSTFGGGGGGGGRAAIYYNDGSGYTASANCTASGGAGFGNGTDGTIAFFDTSIRNDHIFVYHDFIYPAGEALNFGAITVETSGTLALGGATVNVTGAVDVTGDSVLICESVNTGGASGGVGTMLSAGNVTVDPGSAISADGEGYLGGTANGQPGAGPGGGQTTTSYGAGGGYGGAGGAIGVTGGGFGGVSYDLSSDLTPVDLGSGGSAYLTGTSPGGEGGGAIRMTVSQTLTLNGVISANGLESPLITGGNGSGGSLFITTGTLAGSGTFSANGGSGPGYGGGGGGGRVAIYYGDGSAYTAFANSTTSGGAGYGNGADGTIAFFNTAANDLSVYHQFIYAAESVLNFANVTVATTGTLALGGGSTLTVSGSLAVTGSSSLICQSINNTALVDDQWLGSGVVISASSVDIGPGSSISADAQGYLGGAANGAGGLGLGGGHTLTNASNGGYAGGGGYGGAGGAGVGSGGGAYDPTEQVDPTDLGSGGAATVSSSASGGNGGGAIQLAVAGNLNIDGSISANGAGYGNGVFGSGGGSGGSLLISAATVTGSGLVSVNGGGPAYACGGGGGGRVAIYDWVSSTFTAANVTAVGGTSNDEGNPGSNGSVYLSGQPYFYFTPAETQPLYHGGQVISYGLVAPVGLTAEVTISNGNQVYLDQTVVAGLPVTWDTTSVADGNYTETVTFKNTLGQVVGSESQTVGVNNNSAAFRGGVMATSGTWGAGTVNVVTSDVIIPAGVTLTIAPGAIVKFAYGTNITVQNGGILNAPATSGQPIIFTSIHDSTAGGNTNMITTSQAEPGDWQGIFVLGTGQFNQTAFVQIRDLVMFLSGNIASNQTLIGSTVYVSTGNITVLSGVTLTIQPGAVLKFTNDGQITVQTGGVLNAVGTAAQPITFTSINDDSVGGTSASAVAPPAPGDWVGLNLSGTSTLSGCNYFYGGNTGNGTGASGVIIQLSGTLSLADSVVSITLYDGVSILGGTATITNSVVTNTTRAIWAAATGVASVYNCTIDNDFVGLDSHFTNTPIVAANCIISNYISAASIDELPTLSYSDIWTTGTAATIPDGLVGANGNISANPAYVDESSGNFRLSGSSPCIDAGNGTVAPSTDFLGDARVNDALVTTKTGVPDSNGNYPDMGAFEFVANAPSNLDLTVTSVTGSATALAGSQATIQWTDENIGAGKVTGPWHDSIYLVRNPGPSQTEIFAGQVAVGQGTTLGTNQTLQASAQVRVPGDVIGNHYWEIKTNSLAEVYEGQNTGNNTLVATAPTYLDLPELTLDGTALAGQFDSQITQSWYKFIPGAGQNIQVSAGLTSGSDGALGLYIAQGFMPSPQNYQITQTQYNSAAVDALAANTTAQVYYVLLNANSLLSPSASFSISAAPTTFGVISASPSTVANAGSVTIAVHGGNLAANMTYQLIGPGGTIAATGIYVVNSSLVYATFNLAGVATGSYTLKVNGASMPGNVTVAAAGATPVAADADNNISLSINFPSEIRIGRTSVTTVNYVNTGNTDAPAPIIFLVPANGLLRFQGDVAWQPVLEGLGINQSGPPGILPPGAGGSLQVEYKPNFGSGGFPPGSVFGTPIYATSASARSPGSVKKDFGPSSFEIDLSALLEDPGNAVSWFNIGLTLQPPGEPDDAWAAIYPLVQAKVGTTYGQLQTVLDQDATYLAQLGEPVFDVSQLLEYEIYQADDFGQITQRYILGAFGRGVPDPTFELVTAGNDGDVIVSESGQIRYFSLQDDGSFLPQPGDYGTLIYSGGIYQLMETDGFITSFLPDGTLNYTQDTNGNRITANYTNGVITGFTDSTGDTITYQYTNGLVTQVTDELGRVTTLAYDANQNLVQMVNSSGTTSYTYITGQGAALEHAVSSVTNPDGTHLFLQYDANGRLIEQNADGGALAITYAYDSFGNATATDAAGVKTTANLDLYGNVGQFIDPFNQTASFTYDANQNLTYLASTTGQEASFAYDDFGDPIQIVDPLGLEIDENYGTFGNLASLIDPLGDQLGFQYDTNGNEIADIYQDRSEDQYGFDSTGDVTRWTTRNNKTIQYTYDAHHLPVLKTLPDNSTVAYTYDVHRNIASIVETAGTTSFTYDSADRLTRETYPSGKYVQFSYNSGGQRIQMTSQDGFTVDYSYTPAGQIASLTGTGGAPIVSYTYGSNGRITQKQFANGTASLYTYNAAGLLDTLSNLAPGGTPLSQFQYGYDSEGRVTSVVSLSGTTSYNYDLDDELASVTLPGGRSLTYHYDGAGNRTSVVDSGTTTSYSVNGLNEYTAAGSTSYIYDTAGNLVARMTASGTTTYGYDVQDRLVSVTSPTDTWTYQYNDLNQRISVVHNGQETDEVWDPFDIGNLVAEYPAGGTAAHYTYGLDLTSRVDAGTGSASYYSFDGVDNTVGLTDASGNVLNSYSYLPYGEKLSTSGSAPNPFTFAGEDGVADLGEGIYFMRNRSYDPAAGRFIQPDPIGLAGESANLYRYVDNDPTGLVDPNGEVPFRGHLDDLHNTDPNVFESTQEMDKKVEEYKEGAVESAKNAKEVRTLLTEGPVGLLKEKVEEHVADKIEEHHGVGLGNGGLVKPGGHHGVPPSKPNRNHPGPNPKGGNHGPKNTGKAKGSTDPNEKIGPAGSGTAGFIADSGAIPYEIDFTNEANASAAAQEVVVTDQLDSNLDWSTFQLQSISFNNVTITVPTGLQSYTTEVNVLTDPNPVSVTASLNPQTGVVTWTMMSIDPLTGELVTDPTAGFLPPDNAQGDGEGTVTYSVDPKAGLGTGTQIKNEASVVFDVNAPIVTNQTVNTIDSTLPASSVTTLPASSPDYFFVSWTGGDGDGSGIQSYDVYYSTDGGATWLAWLTGTTETSALFAGQPGTQYEFYSVATSNVGNISAAKITADAITETTTGNMFQANVVLAQNDPAPGVADSKFLLAGSPAVDALGDVVFKGVIGGTTRAAGISGTNNQGIWSYSGTTGNLVVRTGQPALDTAGAILSTVSDPALQEQGAIIYTGELKGGDVAKNRSNDTGVWLIVTGSQTLLVRAGGTAADQQGATYKAFPEIVTPQPGAAAFLATLAGPGVKASNGSGLWSMDLSGTFHSVVRAGEALGSGRVISINAFANPKVVKGQSRTVDTLNGNLAFGVTLTNNESALFAAAPQTSGFSLTEIASTGASGTTGIANIVWSSFGSPATNANGTIVFRGILTGASKQTKVSASENTGIWINSGTIMSLLARAGSAAPGLHGALFGTIDDPVINNDDQVAFIGAFAKQKGVVTSSNSAGIWATTGGSLQLIAQQGSTAPGVPGGKFASFAQLALPDAGGPVFIATMSGVKPGTTTGLWSVGADGATRLVGQTGDIVNVHGKSKVVRSFSIFVIDPQVAGQSRNFDASTRAFACVVTFTDGTWAVLQGGVP